MSAASRARLPLLSGGTAAIALVVRVVAFRHHSPLLFGGSDNAWYEAVARSLARGDWGRLPGVDGDAVLSVRFPPGYPAVLSTGERLLFWVDPTTAHQWTSALLGAVAAAVVTVLAWRLTGRASEARRTVVAAVAGLLVACNPIVVGTSVSLMSEALVLPLVAAVLVLCDRLLCGGGRGVAAGVLGVLLGLGAVTRGEALVTLGAPLVAAALVARRRPGGPRRARPWLLAVGIGVVVALGWSVAASLAAGRPVVLSTNSGSLLLGANCDAARRHGNLGYWSGACPDVDLGLSAGARAAVAEQVAAFEADPFPLPPVVGAPHEAEIGTRQTAAALDEIAEDPTGFARAVPVRLARGLGVYWTGAQTFQEGLEGRDTTWEGRGRWFHLVLVLPATLLTLVAAGWRRSRVGGSVRALTDVGRLAPMIALLAAWALMVMATYGSARFRTTIEPALAVLAALGFACGATLLRARGQASRSSAAS